MAPSSFLGCLQGVLYSEELARELKVSSESAPLFTFLFEEEEEEDFSSDFKVDAAADEVPGEGRGAG